FILFLGIGVSYFGLHIMVGVKEREIAIVKRPIQRAERAYVLDKRVLRFGVLLPSDQFVEISERGDENGIGICLHGVFILFDCSGEISASRLDATESAARAIVVRESSERIVVVLFGGLIVADGESVLPQLPTAPRSRLARDLFHIQRSRERPGQIFLRLIDISIQYFKTGKPDLHRTFTIAGEVERLRHLPKHGRRLIVIAQLQQRVGGYLIRKYLVGSKLHQPLAVLARFNELVRRILDLCLQLQSVQIALFRKNFKRGLRSPRRQIEIADVARLAQTLNVATGKHIVSDHIFRIFFYPILKISDRFFIY